MDQVQRAVIERYHEALGRGDFAGARGLMRDDLRFEGPFEASGNPDDSVASLQRLWGIVRSIDIRHVSSDADEVVVLYDMETNTPAGTQLICEWYGLQDGKIAWIRALFDRAPFAFLRQEGSGPTAQ